MWNLIITVAYIMFMYGCVVKPLQRCRAYLDTRALISSLEEPIRHLETLSATMKSCGVRSHTLLTLTTRGSRRVDDVIEATKRWKEVLDGSQ